MFQGRSSRRKLSKMAAEGACLGNWWGPTDPVVLIARPTTGIITTWVKPGPSSTQARQDEKLTREPLKHHTDSWTGSALFWNVRYGCDVLSFPSESIMASSDSDLAKIIAWVQRPISSCYFGLCKLPALSSSCSVFFQVSVPFSRSGRWAGMTRGWKPGNRKQRSKIFVGLFPCWLVSDNGQTRSPQPQAFETWNAWKRQKSG